MIPFHFRRATYEKMCPTDLATIAAIQQRLQISKTDTTRFTSPLSRLQRSLKRLMVRLGHSNSELANGSD